MRGKLLPCVLLVGACLQPVDDNAATPPPPVDPNAQPTTTILPTALPIGLSVDDEGQTTDDPCVKTRRDKTEILTAYCAPCHSGATALGLPPWNFVLDDAKLVTEQWIREGQPPQRFVIPGDPDHSAIYVRAAIVGDMPPQPTDLGSPRNPRPSLSDLSVLREWIMHCAPGAPAEGGGAGGAGGGGGGAGGDAPDAGGGSDGGSANGSD
jgi:hypothetical protein